jgi:hypothetical protein
LWGAAAEAAECFFVQADLGGQRVEGGAELVDLHGQAGES